MRGTFSRAMAASLAALTLAAAVLPAGQAAAAPFRDTWDDGWWSGWQGRAGGRYGYREGWGPAVVVTAPYCVAVNQPVYDVYGGYVGQQIVNVC